jgi:mRNA-degrading endonuclease toxin of MazEF toxin-antitoxin module
VKTTPSMTTCKRGDVVVVNVVFKGQGGSKPRPDLVVSADLFHKKLPLKHWKTAGLRHPSTVRVSNIVAVEKKIIKRALGDVHADDLAAVEQQLRTAFHLWPLLSSLPLAGWPDWWRPVP